MKVVCINNVELGRDSYGKPRHNILPLTIGKVYEVVDEESPSHYHLYQGSYLLVDDKLNLPLVFSRTHFVSIDVWREIQLNKMGI